MFSKRFEEGKVTVFLNENGFLIMKSVRQPPKSHGKDNMNFGKDQTDLRSR